jgi:hypothetical protein
MKIKHLLGFATLTAGLLVATPAFAKGGGAGKGGQPGEGRGGNYAGYCQSIDGRGAGLCDATGPGQGVPLQDGSGKASKGKGTGSGKGTPLKDGSGNSNGGKGYGKNSDGSCPNG